MTITFDDATYTRDSGATRVNEFGLIVGVDFSTTSVTFGTGAKTFTLAADANINRDWLVGSRVRATSQAAPLGLMNGTVTSYNAATQELVIEVTTSTGTGSGTNWRIGSLEFRRDFDPVTLAAKGGLVEGGATNLVFPSHAEGFALNGSNTLSATNDPNTGKKSIVMVGAQQARPGNINVIASTEYEVYAIFKLSNLTQTVTVTTGGGLSGSGTQTINLATKTVTFAGGIFASGSRDAIFEPVAAGLYKIGYKGLSGGANQQITSLSFAFQDYAGVEMVASQVANGSGGSYIPTTTTSVSRAADLLSATGSSFTEAVNQTQGTLLIECIPTDSINGQAIASLNDGTAANDIRIGQKNSGTRSSIRAIASDGVTDVMAVNAGTNTLRSNGVDYTAIATGVLTNAFAVASSSANNFLIGGNAGRYSRTTDGGLSYTNFQMDALDQAQLNGAAFGNGTYVVVGNAINGSGLIATVDPVTFAYTRRVSVTTGNILSVRLLDGVFYATTQTNTILRSSDAITWAAVTGNLGFAVRDITFGSGKHLAVIDVGRVSVSTNGGTTFSPSTLSGVTTQQLNGANFANDLFVAVGNAGAIITSPNGTTWTLRTSGTTANLFAAHYSTRDQQWYAAGDSGTILRSVDAITWTNIANDATVGIFTSGALMANPIAGKFIPNQTNRIAIGYDTLGVSLSINGGNVVTDPSITLPLMSQLNIGTDGLNAKAANAHIKTKAYRVKVSDAELQALSRVI